ncbi:MAG: polysulfide reductase NrfD, partial [Caldilineaceae bacterium]|nr:polysulfide reductase NrfD [Caldilineaceae bacterium]
ADVIPLHPAPTNGAMALLEGSTNGHESSNGHNGHAAAATAPAKPRRAQSGAALRPAQPQGEPWRGPIQMGQGRMAEQMVQVAYNAQHLIPWHWPVPAYLVTKAIGSGIFMVLALGWLLKIINFAPGMAVLSGFLSLLFIGITTALLVLDLERPERFLKIITRPQWNSWLTRGAFILIGFSLLLGVWWILETAAYVGIGSPDAAAAFRPIAIWLGLPLAVGTAVYTAFLFGQAEGRDLWQSSLLPFHLLVQALMVGSGIVLLLDVIMPVSDGLNGFAFAVLAISLVVDLFVTLLGEFGMPHASDAAAKAAHAISNGRYRNLYWWGSIGLGHVVPLILLWLGHPALTAQAGIYAIIGLFLFEYAFVMAPQDVPNS